MILLLMLLLALNHARTGRSVCVCVCVVGYATTCSILHVHLAQTNTRNLCEENDIELGLRVLTQQQIWFRLFTYLHLFIRFFCSCCSFVCSWTQHVDDSNFISTEALSNQTTAAAAAASRHALIANTNIDYFFFLFTYFGHNKRCHIVWVQWQSEWFHLDDVDAFQVGRIIDADPVRWRLLHATQR